MAIRAPDGANNIGQFWLLLLGDMRWGGGGPQQPPNVQSIPQTLLRKLKMKANRDVNNLRAAHNEIKLTI